MWLSRRRQRILGAVGEVVKAIEECLKKGMNVDIHAEVLQWTDEYSGKQDFEGKPLCLCWAPVRRKRSITQ